MVVNQLKASLSLLRVRDMWQISLSHKSESMIGCVSLPQRNFLGTLAIQWYLPINSDSRILSHDSQPTFRLPFPSFLLQFSGHPTGVDPFNLKRSKRAQIQTVDCNPIDLRQATLDLFIGIVQFVLASFFKNINEPNLKNERTVNKVVWTTSFSKNEVEMNRTIRDH